MLLPINIPTRHDDGIQCPRCGFGYLHHDSVDVFSRREDANSGQHTHVPGSYTGMVLVRECLAGNPSERRGGIRIAFWCEGCLGRSSLCIAQHKGASFLYWDPPGLPNRTER
jgi:hypothetical protein